MQVTTIIIQAVDFYDGCYWNNKKKTSQTETWNRALKLNL